MSEPFLDVERLIDLDEGQTPKIPKEGKGEPSNTALDAMRQSMRRIS